MAEFDVVVVGGGHNGLVAGALLAKVKKRVLILERNAEVGGILRGAEIAPGVHAPGLAHTVGRLRPSLVKDLKLREHGLELLRPDALLFAPRPDGPGITFWRDAQRTSSELGQVNEHDARVYPEVDKRVRALASFLAYVNAATPPDVESPSIADAIAGLKLGKAFKDLGTKPSREATRALPMAIADFIREGFDDDGVCGALAARAVLFTSMGAWAAGSAAVLLFDSAGTDGGVAGQTTFAKGGTQALANALARSASAFGAEIRTGAAVDSVSTADGRANGVRLSTGEVISARAVAVTVDPKRVLTELVDPVLLGPELVWRGGNIRTPGTTAKVDLALSGLPQFRGGTPEALAGRIVISTGIDYLERSADAAKYGEISEAPLLEATIPSIVDDSLAPEGRHVMSVLFQSAPYSLRTGWDDAARERVGDLAVKTLESFAPGFGELVAARRVQTPPDLEREYGLSGGYAYHQEPGLDAFFAWKPLLGHARYRFGVPGLYLAGSGAHPGGGITGAPGANAARVIASDLKRSK
jgi:phytoene dehydrogenase-like protein